MKIIRIISFLIAACLPAAGFAQSIIKEDKAPTVMKYLTDAHPQYAFVVQALNASDLTATLEAKGPYTLFVPANSVFEAMSAGARDSLMQPENADSLQKILTNHVVSGDWPLADLQQKIKEGGGEFFLPTIGGGGRLSFIMSNGRVMVKDAHGFTAFLPAPVSRTNGLVYTIDRVLMP